MSTEGATAVAERAAESGQPLLVTVLSLGQVIGEGSPEEVRNNPAVRDAYLG